MSIVVQQQQQQAKERKRMEEEEGGGESKTFGWSPGRATRPKRIKKGPAQKVLCLEGRCTMQSFSPFSSSSSSCSMLFFPSSLFSPLNK
jgi:hypothetical protein